MHNNSGFIKNVKTKPHAMKDQKQRGKQWTRTDKRKDSQHNQK